MHFDNLLAEVMPPTPTRVAVAAAEDDVVLRAAVEAYQRKLAEPILCGRREAILQIAEQARLDISFLEIVDADLDNSAKAAVSLVREGRASMLMKGLLQTADLLRAVLDKEKGLHTKGNLLSHVSIFHSPLLQRKLLLTDAAVVTYPDLTTKVKMIHNAVKAAKGIGISHPKVAALAPVEVINSEMQSSVDAAVLTIMNRRGQIKGCTIDGPLAMDLALSSEAAKHKEVESPVAGCADILLLHNIDVANCVIKTFTVAGNCLLGGVLMGANAPIVLTSRSDSDQSKLYSIACAASIAILDLIDNKQA